MGGEVRLSFTVPLDTTDGDRNRAGMQAAVCRAGLQVVAPAACVEVARVAITPGEVKYVDALPASLRAGPPVLLEYAVQLLNARGRTAGKSETAFAVGGEAPPAVSGLSVMPRRGAVLIRWQPEKTAAETEVTRRSTNAAAAATPARKPDRGRLGFSGLGGKAKDDGGVLQLSGGHAPDAGGMIDRGVRDQEGYTYRAQRVQRVVLAGHSLELRGPESAVVTISYQDVFPPGPPTDLVAVAGGGGGRAPSIDLVWDASAEEGVTGYTVYRRDAGEFRKLATTQVAAYRDLTVSLGVQYTYRVTATDARGNESGPSAEMREMVRP